MSLGQFPIIRIISTASQTALLYPALRTLLMYESCFASLLVDYETSGFLVDRKFRCSSRRDDEKRGGNVIAHLITFSSTAFRDERKRSAGRRATINHQLACSLEVLTK